MGKVMLQRRHSARLRFETHPLEQRLWVHCLSKRANTGPLSCVEYDQ
jgi:hypothetical protein